MNEQYVSFVMQVPVVINGYAGEVVILRDEKTGLYIKRVVLEDGSTTVTENIECLPLLKSALSHSWPQRLESLSASH